MQNMRSNIDHDDTRNLTRDHGRRMPLTQSEAGLFPRPWYVEGFNETQMKTRYVKSTTPVTRTLFFAGSFDNAWVPYPTAIFLNS